MTTVLPNRIINIRRVIIEQYVLTICCFSTISSQFEVDIYRNTINIIFIKNRVQQNQRIDNNGRHQSGQDHTCKLKISVRFVRNYIFIIWRCFFVCDLAFVPSDLVSY